MKRLIRSFIGYPISRIEVRIFLSPSIPREPIYARLGVPEIWRFDGERLTVRLLGRRSASITIL